MVALHGLTYLPTKMNRGGRESKGEIFSALSRVARRDTADFKRIDDAGDAQNVRLTQVALLPRHVGHYF